MNQSRDAATAPGVIFDLDGTLADTLQDITEAVNVSLGQFGLPAQPTDRIRAFVGDGLSQLMSRAARTHDPDRVDALVAGFRAHYSLNYLRYTRLYPGIKVAVSQLRRAGCLISVLSNKPHDFTQRICDELLSAVSIAGVVGACDDYPNKPDPTAALMLARQMGCAPQDVVMVGDSAIDVETARNAGMRCVAVTWGFRDRPELEASGPDAIVDGSEDLPGAILS